VPVKIICNGPRHQNKKDGTEEGNLSLRISVMTSEIVGKVSRKHLPDYVTERPG
jgi:hypothetical protein